MTLDDEEADVRPASNDGASENESQAEQSLADTEANLHEEGKANPGISERLSDFLGGTASEDDE